VFGVCGSNVASSSLATNESVAGDPDGARRAPGLEPLAGHGVNRAPGYRRDETRALAGYPDGPSKARTSKHLVQRLEALSFRVAIEPAGA
jgi:hypothetical protein